MIDTRFYQKSDPIVAYRLAEIVDARLADDVGDLVFADIAGLLEATPDCVSFLSNQKAAPQLATCKAGGVLVSEKLADACGAIPTLICADPYRAMALAAQYFYPQAARSLPMPGNILSDMQDGLPVHPSAKIEENVQIGVGAIIGAQAHIGRDSSIASGAIIGHGVVIGRGCTIGANTVIGYALIGDNVIIAANTTIGSDGFGFAMGAQHIKIPQLGRVIIQADVEMGAACTIDRGSFSDTIIGEGCKLDNQVHLAHNVVLGRHCIITGQCGIAGSTHVGDYVQMGGQAGVAGHLQIGEHSRIGAAAGVLTSIPTHSDVTGVPARPLKEVYRDLIFVKKLRQKNKQDK